MKDQPETLSVVSDTPIQIEPNKLNPFISFNGNHIDTMNQVALGLDALSSLNFDESFNGDRDRQWGYQMFLECMAAALRYQVEEVKS